MATHDGSSSTSSSSSSSSSSSIHDVFLSFRGTDTRNNFTGFLHSALKREGIDAFIDSEDLWGGDDIKSALLEAIRRSKISIPIFSEGYADSKWCLMELVEIVRCHQSNGQIILPTFLDVHPADVRNQIGSFKGSFEKHIERYGAQTVKIWKEALIVVAGISGYELKQVNGNQSKLVKLIVERALSESSGNRLADTNNLVGLDARVKEIEDLLNIGSNEVRFVGICGIGGIGKTTIAKALYNRIFKSFRRSSFLANIREEASRPNGLVSLQEQLISSIYKRKIDANIGSVHRGKELIIEKLQGENVLLVLDDVDCRTQLDALAIELNWFGPASKIIITSRDEHILELAKVGGGNIYWPKELDDKQSLQLFSLHAFSSDQPPEEYIQLSHDIIHLTGGLPLTLEVLGSSLFGIREIDVWQSMLRKLKKNPNREVCQTLKISYDNLDNDEKSMFLDAACFFVGWRKDTVVSMWEACGFEAILAIKKLTQRSLLRFTNKVSYGAYRESITSYDELSMHDQIQAMGRDIVLEGSRWEPGERSRLWSHDDILEVLEEHMGTPKIEGILPQLSDHSRELFPTVSVHREDFAKMSKLRYLYIDGAKSEVDFPHLPLNLRWFRWRLCFRDLPSDFYHKKLVHMDQSSSWIKQAWRNKPRNEYQRFQNLKVLNLQNCWELSESPEFSWFPNLEELDLHNCKHLVNLHKSIGDLKYLVKLCMCRTGIKELPDSICRLSSLKYLNFSYCYSVEKLPESIGDLKSLVELEFIYTKIENLPDSIWRLSSLKRLSLGTCTSVKKLSESIGDLKSLVELDLSQTNIEELPDSICKLNSLEKLNLHLCPSLTKLPESFGNLNSLVSLELQIVNIRLESLPGFPLTLTHLGVENFISLGKADFSSLKKLRTLRIGGCKKLEEIRGLEDTESLEEFFMSACDIIESIPKLPSSLITLRVVSSNSVQKLPDLSNLKKLRMLNLNNCRKLEEIQGLERTESLEEFVLCDNDAIESFPKLPSTLTFMGLTACNSVKKLPDLSNLKNLRALRTRSCERLEEIPGLEGTESLAVLDFDDCNTLTDTPKKILGQGRLLVDESQRTDSLNVNDGTYKRLSLCLVLALEEAPRNVEEGQPVIIRVYHHASVHGKDRRIQCVTNLRIEGLKYTTGRDIIYIHQFKGFDWFGLPLEGKHAVEIINISAGAFVPDPYQSIGCKVKFWKLLLENKASEQQQMINQEECSARMVADFFNWSFDHARRSPSDTGEEVHMVSSPSSNDGESSSHGDGESSYSDCESSSFGNGDSSYHDCGSSSYGDDDSSYHDCESSYEESE